MPSSACKQTARTEIYTLSLHDALPIWLLWLVLPLAVLATMTRAVWISFALSTLRSEDHTSELQSLRHLVCRLLLANKRLAPRSTLFPYTTLFRSGFSGWCCRWLYWQP